jgi:hypothetical protein
MGGRELNEVGSIGSGRALEGAIVYGMGNMGKQKIGLMLPAGVKRVRAGKQFGRTIGRVVAE